MDNIIDINGNKPRYIVVVKIGDPHTNFENTSSFGLFNNRDEADKFVVDTYSGTNYICELVPFNNKDLLKEINSE